MSQSSPGEFQLIKRYFQEAFRGQIANSRAVLLGIGDDCAMLSLPPGEELLVSVDTLNCGVHFPENAAAEKLAYRALAVSVSDLAAMGAKPLGFTLCLSAPELQSDWLQLFSNGLAAAAAEFGIPLVGGDTTRGALSLSVQVMGSAPREQALLRSGAKVGDLIVVSGSLGDARAALNFLDSKACNAAETACLDRYWSPTPRIMLGLRLGGLASSAIDVSDGLAADLGHILVASGVGAKIELAALPLSAALNELYSAERATGFALSGGDDYELCFTIAPALRHQLSQLAGELALNLTVIGEIEAKPGLRCVAADGEIVLPPTGYQHF